MTRSWNSILKLCNQFLGGPDTLSSFVSSPESWSSTAPLECHSPTGVPQSLCASLGRAWPRLASMAWLGWSSPRVRLYQGRTCCPGQTFQLSHQGMETPHCAQAVPWLCWKHCKPQLWSSSSSCCTGAAAAWLCSRAWHLSPSHHTSVTWKASRAMPVGPWAQEPPCLSTSSQPDNGLKCQHAGNSEGIGEIVVNFEITDLRRVCFCMHSPDLLTPPLPYGPAPEVLICLFCLHVLLLAYSFT